MKITYAPAASRQGPDTHFTGPVWSDEVALPTAPSRLRIYNVHFSPGSRTAWHAHPVGQLLQITDGRGCVQRRGGPVEHVRMGDTIWFEPNEWHWHGAGPTSFMSHLAIQETDVDGSTAELGSHVTDAEYTA